MSALEEAARRVSLDGRTACVRLGAALLQAYVEGAVTTVGRSAAYWETLCDCAVPRTAQSFSEETLYPDKDCYFRVRLELKGETLRGSCSKCGKTYHSVASERRRLEARACLSKVRSWLRAATQKKTEWDLIRYLPTWDRGPQLNVLELVICEYETLEEVLAVTLAVFAEILGEVAVLRIAERNR